MKNKENGLKAACSISQGIINSGINLDVGT